MAKQLPSKNCNLVFHKTITKWDEAIPLGNGLCGALIWGAPRNLRFSLDRGDVWDNTPFKGIFSHEFTYENMVRLVREGKEEEIRRIFDGPYNHPLPTKLPVGKLIFDFGCDQAVVSELDLATAQAHIQIGNSIVLRSYLHAENKIGFISIDCPDSGFSYSLENPQYGIKGKDEFNGDREVNSVNTASLKSLVYEAPIITKEPGKSSFTQKITEDFSYGVFVRSRQSGNHTEMVYLIASSCDGPDWQQQASQKLETALQEGYEANFISHCSWWKEYWSQSSVSLPDPLFEKNWYLTQYFLASCSRKGCYPMPLQGVWTADDGSLPPWKGDYHHDLNTQMSYYSYLKGNHLPEGESYLDFLWNLADCGRKFAKSFFHTDGLCLPSTMTLTGAPLGGWGMYSLSPTNQIWLCQAFERYYRTTGDRKFLQEKAYPFFSETGECILGLLEEHDGQYFLPISSSPEIHDDTIQSLVTPNSNYDLALMRYLFQTLKQMSEILENGEANRWQEILEKLPDLSIAENGVLMVSPDECLEESHRHFSHAMSIHPLRLIPYEGEENRRIIDATILDMERLGTGYWVGFSFTWMAELYAIQRNGNGAAFQLETFWRNHCSQNGFHLNGDYKKRGTSTFHYRPFTLEANFCAADALQEMLMQSEYNQIRLFPAIPDEWMEKTVSFEGLRAENGVLVSASMEKGELTSLTLHFTRDAAVTLYRDSEEEKGTVICGKAGETLQIR